MVRIGERQSSIETEPRTLNVDQFQFAREAARYVVDTKPLEEALRIFTEGLEPVARCGGEDHELPDLVEEEGQWCDAINEKFGSRDIVTAPF
ncbi:hypothetical protein F511_18958 [Dorcoceras hygrometricum]|uniref:Uncharacterized protein n=1 Tax=Dorcoceras hygrometricum TaxID=472368 RepID=A0A2Z7D4M4_9LAMI|nr:hypothetical protein F511_18958 [Dorcoceras hygrometricum]